MWRGFTAWCRRSAAAARSCWTTSARLSMRIATVCLLLNYLQPPERLLRFLSRPDHDDLELAEACRESVALEGVDRVLELLGVFFRGDLKRPLLDLVSEVDGWKVGLDSVGHHQA